MRSRPVVVAVVIAILTVTGGIAYAAQPNTSTGTSSLAAPPPADSKFRPESRKAETHREDSAYPSRFCPRVGLATSAYLGGPGGPSVAPAERASE